MFLNNDLYDLIPQKDPFVMIDHLISSDQKQTTTSFTIKHNNYFSENGFFRETGIIENIAQTAAAGAGLFAREQNKKPNLGYIASVKNFKLFFLPPANKTIYTTISIKTVIDNISVIEGIVKCDDNIAATCEMTIFEQNINI
jgi:predicted hotdog family 3-hydroxylacyl-ACP dehydratase